MNAPGRRALLMGQCHTFGHKPALPPLGVGLCSRVEPISYPDGRGIKHAVEVIPFETPEHIHEAIQSPGSA